MKIAFCGDILLKTPEQHRLGETLKAKLDECDIRCINFEAPVSIETGIGIHKSGPVICQSSITPKWLIDNGFNLVTLANNHSLDYGQEGLQKTIEAFDSIKFTGVGNYNTAYEACIMEKKNHKIGFLGLTHKEFGCVDMFSEGKLGTAAITSPKVFQNIVKAKSEVEKLYIIAHAGVENIEIPLPEWRELYKSFIDLGADGVIASHPHVPQGFEIYKDCPIVYSMGNFLFETDNLYRKANEWFISLMVIIDLPGNRLEVIPLIYDYQNKVVDIDRTPQTKDKLDYLNLLLKTPLYEKTLQENLSQLDSIYKNMMLNGGAYSIGLKEKLKNLIRPLLGRKQSKPDSIHLLNLFQCESHRWTMMRLLEDKEIN